MSEEQKQLDVSADDQPKDSEDDCQSKRKSKSHKIRIDMNAIPCISNEEQEDELKLLNVTAYHQSIYEEGLLKQVDQVLKTSTGKSHEKRPENVLDTLLHSTQTQPKTLTNLSSIEIVTQNQTAQNRTDESSNANDESEFSNESSQRYKSDGELSDCSSQNKIEDKESEDNSEDEDNLEDEEWVLSDDEQYEKNESFPEFRGALQRGVIPDAKTIYVLKKQRQMAREAADFIALEDDQNYDERYDENEKLENDRSDDDDEDDQRISFAVNKDQNEKEKIKEAFYLAQEEDQENYVKEESDDELDRWERQQIKKGVGMPSIRLLNQEQITEGTNLMEIENQDFKSKKQLIPSYILSRNKNKLTIEEVYSKLSDKLMSLMESCESHKRQLSNLNNQIDFTKNHLKKVNVNKSNNEQQ